jgi:hypothetical protein
LGVIRYSLILVVVTTGLTACHKTATTPINTQEENAKISGGGVVISENEAKKHIGEMLL